MTTRETRLQRLEAAQFRWKAAQAGAPHGIGPDEILRACLRWLSLPVGAMRAEHPTFSPDECLTLKRSLPAIALALQSRGRPAPR